MWNTRYLAERTDQNRYAVPNFLVYFYFMKIRQNKNRHTTYAQLTAVSDTGSVYFFYRTNMTVL